MIPMMIQQGYSAIAVVFDVWGIANLLNDGIKQAKEFAQQAVLPAGAVKLPAGKQTNGTS